MFLRLLKVSYTEITGAQGVIDPSLYQSYDTMGGVYHIDPVRGEYSPVYLEMPFAANKHLNFQTKLVVKTDNLAHLPAKNGRVYDFFYSLRFETSSGMFFQEKEGHDFTLTLYPDLASFKQCFLPSMTYFVDEPGYIDLHCLAYSIEPSINEDCSPQYLQMTSKHLRSFSSGNSDNVPFNSLGDPYKLDVSDVNTPLYGYW